MEQSATKYYCCVKATIRPYMQQDDLNTICQGIRAMENVADVIVSPVIGSPPVMRVMYNSLASAVNALVQLPKYFAWMDMQPDIWLVKAEPKRGGGYEYSHIRSMKEIEIQKVLRDG